MPLDAVSAEVGLERGEHVHHDVVAIDAASFRSILASGHTVHSGKRPGWSDLIPLRPAHRSGHAPANKTIPNRRNLLGAHALDSRAAVKDKNHRLAVGLAFLDKLVLRPRRGTWTCHNPPIDDCTKATILGLVGQYAVSVHFGAPAPFSRPTTLQDPAVDEANDGAQEDAIKKPFAAAAKSVMAVLG